MESGSVTDLQWSPDGQILSVATSTGNICNFLVNVTTTSETYTPTVRCLSSLRERLVVDSTSQPKDAPGCKQT